MAGGVACASALGRKNSIELSHHDRINFPQLIQPRLGTLGIFSISATTMLPASADDDMWRMSRIRHRFNATFITHETPRRVGARNVSWVNYLTAN